jgi:hypothetical protein
MVISALTQVLIAESDWYLKPSYPDYAPSGMPDFDEKQDNWGPNQGTYTWCGPVAVANSLWWLDSEYESKCNPLPTPPPTNSDSFPLVVAYGAWDDHSPNNVDPLVKNLAFLMHTDGQGGGPAHIGTYWQDMVVGVSQYVQQQGLSNMFEVHFSEFPQFDWIEHEIERCQDVVLFLEFWHISGGAWQPLTSEPNLEAGHFVTCAGVNSSTSVLLISDPYQDAFEAQLTPGRSPVQHGFPHPTTVHNDAQYVSQDAYVVAPYLFQPPPPPPQGYPIGSPVWELAGYLQTLGYDPSWHTFIRVAVVTSPIIHDVAVSGIETSKTGCLPMPTVGQDYTIPVNVTVANQGDFQETFNVTAYVNETAHANQTVIGSQQITLGSGATQVVTFNWNTSGYIMGNYTLSAVADTVPGETPDDTADNTFNDGVIYVGIPGDVDANHKVDIKDILIVAKAYGTNPQSPNWNPNPDVDCNDKVDVKDILIAAKNYGKP